MIIEKNDRVFVLIRLHCVHLFVFVWGICAFREKCDVQSTVLRACVLVGVGTALNDSI